MITFRSETLQLSRGTVTLLAWCIAIVLGLIHLTASPFAMNADGISYLHLASLYAQGDWRGGFDACWSPLYPLALALFIKVLQPTSYWDAPVAHLAGFFVYLAAFAAFRYFLHSLRVAQMKRKSAAGWLIDFGHPAETILAYTLFFCTALIWIGMETITPDMMVAAVIYAACGLAIRLRGHQGAAAFAGLGAVAALGYLAKAVMFPLGVVLLICAAFTPRSVSLSAKRALYAFLGFLLVASPQIIGVSSLAGRVTYADTGSMVYARIVNEYPMFWTGHPEGSGTPKNPIRVIHQGPEAHEFTVADTLSSYPFWDRPAYWTAGLEPHFDLARQIDVTTPILRLYGELLFPFLCAILLLMFCRTREIAGAYLFLIVPAMAGFGIYALVYAEARYLGGWAVVLFMSVIATLSYRTERARATRAVLAALAVFLGANLTIQSVRAYDASNEFIPGQASANPHYQIAMKLDSIGIPRGSKVALIGYAFDGYWARLAGVQIAMQVPEWREYWFAPDSVKESVHASFRAAGAAAIIANRAPGEPSEWGDGWISTGLHKHLVYPLVVEMSR